MTERRYQLCFFCDHYSICTVRDKLVKLRSEIHGYMREVKITVEECDRFYTTNPSAPIELRVDELGSRET